jgi:hypothetical protein
MSRDLIAARPVIVALILLAVAAVSGLSAAREPVAEAEALHLWIVRDAQALDADGIGGTLRVIAANAFEALARSRAAALYPPLYPLALDVWTLATSGALIAARALSILLLLVGLAGLDALLRRFLTVRRALLVLALAAAAVVVSPALRQATPHAFLFALAVLSLHTLIVWQRTRARRWALLYCVLVGAAVLTHYAALLMVGVQVIALALQPRGSRWLALAVLIVSGGLLGAWLLLATGAADGHRIDLGRDWLVALGALVLAFAGFTVRVPRIEPLVTVLWGAVLLLAAPALPDWPQAVDQVAAARQGDQPALIGYAPYTAAGYYDRDGALSGGIALNLAWTPRTDAELRALAAQVAANPDKRVWLMAADRTPLALLLDDALRAQGRAPVVCVQAGEMLFYAHALRVDGGDACAPPLMR